MARAQQDLALRFEVEELYTEYAHALDNDELERWPEFFIDECLYQIVSRENRERGLPLALMRCESKAMLSDRVVTIRQTQMFAPRALRHLISSILIAPTTADGVNVQANYAVLQT
ncbi:MAG: aromatic-ring-hydroxylating dioxygenase subunit beta, partial [Candidatus Binataceae bacterium]